MVCRAPTLSEGQAHEDVFLLYRHSPFLGFGIYPDNRRFCTGSSPCIIGYFPRDRRAISTYGSWRNWRSGFGRYFSNCGRRRNWWQPINHDSDLLPDFRTKLSMICAKERGRKYVESNHTEAQMIGALKQLEAGRKAEDVAREVGVSKHTIYAWKAKYGGMDVNEAQEAKQLRDENTKLKKLVVDLSLDKEMLKAVIAKNGWSS